MTYYLTIILLLNGTFYSRNIDLVTTYPTYQTCTAAGIATGLPRFEDSTPWVEGAVNPKYSGVGMPQIPPQAKFWSCGSP